MISTDKIIDLLQIGIKAEDLRQKAISSNVANLETPGYRRVDVRFEELLNEVLKSSEPLDLNELELEIYQPQETPVRPNGNDVSWEAEVGQMVKNSLKHKAYVRLLAKKLKQIELAMSIK